MPSHKPRHPHQPQSRRGARAIASTVAAGLAALGVVSIAGGSALAAGACINPLQAAGGYTVFVGGSAILGNAETEGSVAVHGALGWSKDMPIRHSTGLTPRGYSLPVVPGTGPTAGLPVRVAAGSLDFAGSSSELKVTSEGTITNAQKGYIVTGSQDWSYAWSRAGGQEVRLTKDASQDAQTRVQITGPLTVQPLSSDSTSAATAWANTNVHAGQAVLDEIFSGYAQLEESSTGIAALSASTSADVHQLTLDPGSDAGKRQVTLVDGVTNVLTVTAAQLGENDNWTLAFAGGVQPSASAPLVVNLVAGAGSTFRIPQFSAVNSPNENNPNPYASYVVWNYAGSAALTVKGNLISGAVLAPYASLTTSNNSPIEGQIVAASLTGANGSGEYHYYGYAGCVATTPTTTPTPTVTPTTTVTPTPTVTPTVTPTPTVSPTVTPTVTPTPTPTVTPTPTSTHSSSPTASGTPPTTPSAVPSSTSGGGGGTSDNPSDEPTSNEGAVAGRGDDPAGDGAGAGPADTADPQDDGTEALAATGSSFAPVALAGWILVVAGAVLLVARRRRA